LSKITFALSSTTIKSGTTNGESSFSFSLSFYNVGSYSSSMTVSLENERLVIEPIHYIFYPF